jgi:hypothetical protein
MALIVFVAFPGLNHPSDEDLSLFPTNEDLFAGAPVALGTPVKIETWGTHFSGA